MEEENNNQQLKKTILILGGYGNAGLAIAELLLKVSSSNNRYYRKGGNKEYDMRILLAGRHVQKAIEAAVKLNKQFGCNRCYPVKEPADASNSKCLDDMFSKLRNNDEKDDDDDVDVPRPLVIVASSTSQYAQIVIDAAIRAKVDVLDIQVTTTDLLKSMEKEIMSAGCCFITGGGYHPGLPGAMSRVVANRLTDDGGHVQEITVGGWIGMDWKDDLRTEIGNDTMTEFVELMRDTKMKRYTGGTWKEDNPWLPALKNIDFGPKSKIGKQDCIAMDLDEMHSLPNLYPDVKEVGFYLAGFHWFVNFVVFPFIMLVLWLFPRSACVTNAMGKAFYWSLCAFPQPPITLMLKAEAVGTTTKAGKNVSVVTTVGHDDGYLLTAAPVVACVLQYLDEESGIRKPGVWLQACVVDADRFLEDIASFGVEVNTEVIEME